MDKFISFETAQLAKKRNYPQKNSECGFLNDGNESYDYAIDFINGKAIARPSQSELQDWLETQGMYISIAPDFYVDGINWNWQVLWYKPKDDWDWVDQDNDTNTVTNGVPIKIPIKIPINILTGTGWYGDNGEYPTRHQALEAALYMALMKMDILFRNNSIEKLGKLYGVDQNTMLGWIRPFSEELGEWSFIELNPKQLEIIVSEIGQPKNI